MAFNGSGTFTRIYNWVVDKANGINITASRMDTEFDGIATGLSTCITKDGQTTLTANIPFANYKITGLGNGTARSDAINVGQVQDNQFLYLGTTTGSADAYTLAPSPAITAYTATQQFTAKISATNLTTTPYLQVSAIANPTTTAVIKKLSATKTEIAVAIGDLVANGIYTFQRNSANNAWIVLELSNPATTTTQGISYLSNPIAIVNNTTTPNTDIDFSGGVFNYSDGTGQAVASALTKRLQSSGAWSAGAGGNLLTTGARANSSTYHLYAIYNPTTGVSDYMALLGVSGTAPDPTSVLPSGYTKFKLICSILTDASGNIRTGKYTFFNGGYEFTYNNKVADATLVSLTTTKTPLTISCPAGVRVKGSFNVLCDGIINAKDSLSLFEGGTSIENAKISGGTLLAGANSAFGGTLPCYTNLSRQIEWKTDNYTLSTYLWTFGFTHYTN